MHVLAGCVLDGPEAHTMARREWQEALCPGTAIEPEIIVDDVAFRVREYINGVEMPVGTIRFRADLKVFTDGSATDVGKRFGRSAGSAVQILPDGSSVAIIAAVPLGRSQSAIAGEVMGLALLGLVLARGQPDDTEHQDGCVCKSVWTARRSLRPSCSTGGGGTFASSPTQVSSGTPAWTPSASSTRLLGTFGRRTPDVKDGTRIGRVMTSRNGSLSEPSRGLPPTRGHGSSSSAPGTNS